jgi:hypothetical protein
MRAPVRAEGRLAGYTELAATAIVNGEVGLRGDDVAVHPGAAGLPAGLHGADTGVILAGSLLLAGHAAAGVA